jgi:hypothetical protein
VKFLQVSGNRTGIERRNHRITDIREVGVRFVAGGGFGFVEVGVYCGFFGERTSNFSEDVG